MWKCITKNKRIGDVVMQEGKPIAIPCQALSIKHQGLSTYEKDLIDLSLAVLKWRQYLHLSHVIIMTENCSFKDQKKNPQMNTSP